MQGKLVRDRIPEIIFKNDGTQPRMRVLKQKEYRDELLKKLQEEVFEVRAAKKPKEMLEELADVEEVIDALLASAKLTRKEVSAVQKDKRKKRGGFSKRIYLIQ